MALINLNTINIDKGLISDSLSEIIFYPLITNSGPNGYTLVDNLEDLRLKFSPTYQSENWAYAETLVSLGYKLLISKLISNDYYLSLRIFESHNVENISYLASENKVLDANKDTGFSSVKTTDLLKESKEYIVPTSYSHPKKDVEYDTISLPWKISNRDGIILPDKFTYSFKIYFPEIIHNGGYIFLTLKEDSTNNKSSQSHKLICFGDPNYFLDKINSEISSEIKYINIEGKTRSEIVKEVLDCFSFWGIYKLYEEKDYIVFSSYLPVKNDTSCKYITSTGLNEYKLLLNNKSGNYDIICSGANDYKLIDFYSKESLSVDSIDLEIIKNFDEKFSLYVSIYSGDSIVKTEHFRVSMDPKDKYFIENVLKTSSLISCKWYKNGDISGKFKLKNREDISEINKEEMLNILKDLPVLEEGSFDILVDGGLPEDFQKYLYDTYKDHTCIKLFQLQSTNPLDSTQLMVPNKRKNGVLYTNSFLYLNNVKYPLWLFILALIKTSGKFSGEVFADNYGVLTYKDENDNDVEMSLDKNSLVCDIIFDNYRYIIPSTPIILNKKVFSLDLIWFLTILKNRIIPSINPQLAPQDFIEKFNHIVRSILNTKESRIIGVLITGYKKIDRSLKLEITLSHENSFIDSISIDITINII